MTRPPTILILYTGGTIGMIKNHQSKALKAFDFSQIIDKIPELQLLNCKITSISFEEPMDSSNMNTEYYIKIINVLEQHYATFDGFVILTGSDTMSYISSAVSFMIENLQKPIIFTGSQLPIGDLRTDAKENLITSIEIACAREEGAPIIKEVCLYFEYKLYRANRTTKINAAQFEAFTSFNYPALAESGVHLHFKKDLLYKPSKEDAPVVFRKKLVSDIVVLKLFPGITASTVAHIVSIPKLKAIVLESYGSGNAPNEEWFLNLLKKAINKGIKIVNVTQCAGGSVIQGHYETSVALNEIGVIDGKDITTEAAIAKLMYLLGCDLQASDFLYYFKTSLRGEVTNT